MNIDELRVLVDDWEISLKSEKKAPGTRTLYLLGVRRYLDWCDEADIVEPLGRAPVKQWTADLFEEGLSTATVTNRVVAVKLFSRWMAEEDILDDDPLASLRRPTPEAIPVEPLSTEQLSALIAACSARGLKGNPGALFLARRDEALVRVLIDSGMRAGEVVAMTTSTADVNLREGWVQIRKAKGGKTRRVYISPTTCEAITRYLRERRKHPRAASPNLWLGWPGKHMGYPAMRKALRARAEAAGLEGWHIHAMRHTFSDRWLAKGGSETGLMANNGWSDPSMLRRYTAARREQRAIEEAERLRLGDI